MNLKTIFSLLRSLMAIGFIVALLGGFWWLLSNQLNSESWPDALTTGIAAEPTMQLSSSYPGPLPVSTSLPLLPTIPSSPTSLPDIGITLSNLVDLSSRTEFSLSPDDRPSFIQPATDGNTLVGIVVNSAQGTFSGYIVAVDLSSGESQRISDVTGLASPQVSENYIVWIEKSQLHYYDRATGKEGLISLGVAANNPSISGSIVVWEHLQNNAQAGFQIWGYDLSTGKDFPVVTETHKAEPKISGRWIVYRNLSDQDDVTVGLHATNLDTNEVFLLGRVQRSSYGAKAPPLYAIDVPWVVWSEGKSGDKAALHLFNLDTRNSDVVSIPSCALGDTLLGHPENPIISGSMVVFTGCFQPLGYDIRSGSFFSVPIARAEKQPASFIGWAFANNRLVWSQLVGERGKRQTKLYTALISSK